MDVIGVVSMQCEPLEEAMKLVLDVKEEKQHAKRWKAASIVSPIREREQPS
jgi:hypothetical protein